MSNNLSRSQTYSEETKTTQEEEPMKKKVIKVLKGREKQKNNADGQNCKVLQIHAPKFYKKYSFEFKKEFIKLNERLGLTVACHLKMITRDVASKWIKAFKLEGEEGLKDKRLKNSRPVDDTFDQYLLEIIIEKRAKAFPVSGTFIQTLATQAPPHIKPLGLVASRGRLEKFLRRNTLVRRRKTHQAQVLIDIITQETASYIELLSLYQDLNEDLVFVNMDEIYIPFDLAGDYTCHFKGEKTIDIASHQDAKVGMTLMPCILSNGESLPPLLIFNYPYAKNGTRSFPKKYEHLRTALAPYVVRFTDSGFNKDYILEEYIRKVVLPWKARSGKELVLIIDQAGSHSSRNFTKFLDSQMLFYLYLPAGATHILQPLDVVVNFPLKSEIRSYYTAWLEKEVAKENIQRIEPPNETQLIDWIFKSMKIVTSELVFKSFRPTGILGKFRDLYDAEKLNERLRQMIDDCIEAGEADRPREYMDRGDIRIEELVSEADILLKSEEEEDP